MRRKIRWLLAVVLFVDLMVGAAFLAGGYMPSFAEPSEQASDAETEPEVQDSEVAMLDSLRLLGEELSRRAEELSLREAEVAELLRAPEVLERAGISLDTPGDAPVETADPVGQVSEPTESFKRLQRAYENMEPDSAARALVELAARDRDAVVELLMGWKPRTSGAILDAITQLQPGLAADLSYEIWIRSGMKGPSPPPVGEDD